MKGRRQPQKTTEETKSVHKMAKKTGFRDSLRWQLDNSFPLASSGLAANKGHQGDNMTALF